MKEKQLALFGESRTPVRVISSHERNPKIHILGGVLLGNAVRCLPSQLTTPPMLETPISIELTEAQYEEGRTIGRASMEEAIRKKYRTTIYGKQPQQRRMLDNEQGYCAELSVSLLTGLPWQANEGYQKGAPDVGNYIQVRYSHYQKGHLLVRPKDPKEHLYVLVTATGRIYTLWGGLWGIEAMNDDYLKAPADRPPAYFVPQDKLQPIPILEQ